MYIAHQDSITFNCLPLKWHYQRCTLVYWIIPSCNALRGFEPMSSNQPTSPIPLCSNSDLHKCHYGIIFYVWTKHRQRERWSLSECLKFFHKKDHFQIVCLSTYIEPLCTSLAQKWNSLKMAFTTGFISFGNLSSNWNALNFKLRFSI